MREWVRGRGSPIPYDNQQRLLLQPLPGWVRENDRLVNHSLQVVVDVFGGPAEDGRLQMIFLYWPQEGRTLTADRLFAAVTSMGVKPGGRCRAEVVEHESGTRGVEFRTLLKGQPGPKPDYPMPITRDAFARLLSAENIFSN